MGGVWKSKAEQFVSINAKNASPKETRMELDVAGIVSLYPIFCVLFAFSFIIGSFSSTSDCGFPWIVLDS